MDSQSRTNLKEYYKYVFPCLIFNCKKIFGCDRLLKSQDRVCPVCAKLLVEDASSMQPKGIPI